MSTLPCGLTITPIRKNVIIRPFCVFAGSLQRIDASVVGFNRAAVSFIPVKQFLGPDPKRVGIHINGNIGAAAAILITNKLNPGSYRDCFVYETNAAVLSQFPKRAYAAGAFYTCYEAFADFVTDALIFSGFEVVED